MATIEIGVAVRTRQHDTWLNWLRRSLRVHLRHHSRLRRMRTLPRAPGNMDGRQLCDIGINPARQDRFDWMLDLARRG